MPRRPTRNEDTRTAGPAWTPDDPTPRPEHRLAGLEPENLLAFMALLGLLRALEAAKPSWRPRAYWDVETHPLRPVLTLAEPQTEAAVANAAAEGVAALAPHQTFPDEMRDLKLDAASYRVLMNGASPAREQVLDALVSDGAVNDEGLLLPTPFCLLFGQGHQHFLDRFHDVPAGVLPAKLAKLKSPPNLADPHFIATALFAPWRREDPTDGFRWDAAEDRRYALRAGDPSGDPATTQHGANRLAAIALPLFATIAVRRRGEPRLLAAGTRYGNSGEIAITWPLWTQPATLAGLQALLVHPVLSKDSPDPADLPPGARGGVMRARRISVGKFFCMTPAARIA